VYTVFTIVPVIFTTFQNDLFPVLYKRTKDTRKETVFSHYSQRFRDLVIRLSLRLLPYYSCSTTQVRS